MANLDVCGMHRENHDDGEPEVPARLRAGRTRAPYEYYYRTWNEFGKWSPWERVPVDIRSGGRGDPAAARTAACSLVPVSGRSGCSCSGPSSCASPTRRRRASSSAEDVSERPDVDAQAIEKLQIRLAWSEYVDGKWTPKAVTKEFVEQWPSGRHPRATDVERDYLLTPSIDPTTQELTIDLSDTYWNWYCGRFMLADITSPVHVESEGASRWVKTFPYRYEFGKRRRWAKLELESDIYLRTSVDHGLLPVDTQKGMDVTLDDPFFYRDRLRTYFVRPVQTEIWQWVREPPIWLDIRDIVLERAVLIPVLDDLRPTLEKVKELEDIGVRLEMTHGIEARPAAFVRPQRGARRRQRRGDQPMMMGGSGERHRQRRRADDGDAQLRHDGELPRRLDMIDERVGQPRLRLAAVGPLAPPVHPLRPRPRVPHLPPPVHAAST